MIPLVLLALGLGVALSAYEFSPYVRSRADDYARAIREAFAAHQAADAHLGNAGAAAVVAAQHGHPTDAVVDHAVAATVANQAAAQSTAVAAKSARTADEKAAAAHSAVTVLDREKKIAAALASLGVGQCGIRSYPGVSAHGRDALIARLNSEGMIVTGDNPWNIETHEHGVILRAIWDPDAQVLKLIVTASDAFVPCFAIWDKIEPKVKEIVGP